MVEEEDDDSEVSLPLAPKKQRGKEGSHSGGAKAPGTQKPEAPAAKTSPPSAKTAQNVAPHLVTPIKTAKVHVMAKPAKSPGCGAKPFPRIFSRNNASRASRQEIVSLKTAAVKAAPAKAVPAAKAALAKSAPAKTARGTPVKPAPHGKTAAKKAAPKAAAKTHKKSEPVKKSQPAKKVAPARKHR